MQDDGNLVLYDDNGNAVRSSRNGAAAYAPDFDQVNMLDPIFSDNPQLRAISNRNHGESIQGETRFIYFIPKWLFIVSCAILFVLCVFGIVCVSNYNTSKSAKRYSMAKCTDSEADYDPEAAPMNI